MFDFQYLQMLLMRVDILIHREVKRWQRANADAADLLRGQYISDAEVNALLKQPFGSHWRYMVAPPHGGRGRRSTAVPSPAPTSKSPNYSAATPTKHPACSTSNKRLA